MRKFSINMLGPVLQNPHTHTLTTNTVSNMPLMSSSTSLCISFAIFSKPGNLDIASWCVKMLDHLIYVGTLKSNTCESRTCFQQRWTNVIIRSNISSHQTNMTSSKNDTLSILHKYIIYLLTVFIHVTCIDANQNNQKGSSNALPLGGPHCVSGKAKSDLQSSNSQAHTFPLEKFN